MTLIKLYLNICTKCGSIAIEDNIRNKIICPICGSEEAEPVEVSYAFKLLLEELQGLHIHTKFGLKTNTNNYIAYGRIRLEFNNI